MRWWAVLMLAGAAAPARAQQAAPADGSVDEPEIVVRGARAPRGSVVGDIPPEERLGPADIRSYGVGTVTELLDELAPQTRSGRGGRPVVLLNGRRIAGFQEIRDLPTEAIARVDILPEEVALKYGYRADQRVVNVVLRRRFRGETLELAARAPTGGGRRDGRATADLLRIGGDARFNLHADYMQASALTEDERDVAGEPAGERPYRTLLPATRALTLNLVHARPLGRATATLNGELEVTHGRSLFGLATANGAPAPDPLAQVSSGITGHLGATVNGDRGRWRWTLTGGYDRAAVDTATDRGPDAAGLIRDRARSVQSSAAGDALVTGPLFRLPAGDAFLSVHAGASTSGFSSRFTRAGTAGRGRVSRDGADGQASLDLPVARAGGPVGRLSLNGNLAADRLSDFGTLTRYGYGLNWAPVDAVRLLVSEAVDEDAPTPQQLGNPVVANPNARMFDYLTGTTALVTATTGGNPALRASRRRQFKAGLTVKPWGGRDLTLRADYTAGRTADAIAGFPGATAATAAAFPDRFRRDAAGVLVTVDTRPVNFARTTEAELRYGVNWSHPLKSRLRRRVKPYAGTGPDPLAGLAPPGGHSGGNWRGDGGRGGRGQGSGRLQLALYHTWRFTDRMRVADGGPVLDLLRGDAVGGGGGRPRHELEGQAGYARDGLGARLSVAWRSGTRVDGGAPADPERLRFSALGTANLRLFADLGQRPDWVRRHPWLRGARVTLSADNLFNSRQRVRDAAGLTPVNFQPDLIDPLGRTVRLSLRKLFF